MNTMCMMMLVIFSTFADVGAHKKWAEPMDLTQELDAFKVRVFVRYKSFLASIKSLQKTEIDQAVLDLQNLSSEAFFNIVEETEECRTEKELFRKFGTHIKDLFLRNIGQLKDMANGYIKDLEEEITKVKYLFLMQTNEERQKEIRVLQDLQDSIRDKHVTLLMLEERVNKTFSDKNLDNWYIALAHKYSAKRKKDKKRIKFAPVVSGTKKISLERPKYFYKDSEATQLLDEVG